MRLRDLLTRLASLAFAAALAACDDPVHSDEIDALGGEVDGVDPGPLHRPGQPCTVCHGGSGPGNPEFTVAGTVYAVKGQPAPLSQANVNLVDATGSTHATSTNTAGNFYVLASSWAPIYPLHVSISYQTVTTKMSSHIGRDGSCAHCHHDPVSPSSAGHVYLVSDVADLPGAAR